MTGLFLEDVEVPGYGRCHLRAESGRLAEIGHKVRPAPADVQIDGHGGAVIPGLHDNHLHLLSMAAAAASFDCELSVRRPSTLVRRLTDHVQKLAPRTDVRGVHYDEHRHGWLDREILDGVAPDNPIRLQHRSGHAWVYNSAALQRVPTSTLNMVSSDALRSGWLIDIPLTSDPRTVDLDLAGIGHQLSRSGVTSVCDATPLLDPGALALLADAHAHGAVPQHITVMCESADVPAELTLGPRKVMPPASTTSALGVIEVGIRTARQQNRAVAVHCVTTEHLVLTLMGLQEHGFQPDDRIEHGTLIPVDLIDTLAASPLTVVSQPHLIAERGDHYLTSLPGDADDLIRVKSLLDAGISVRFGSDAPFAAADPWATIRAATTRHTASGQVLGAAEVVSAEQAVGMLSKAGGPTGDPGAWFHAGTRAPWLQRGSPADWCLLNASWSDAAAHPSAELVAATFIAGRSVWQRDAR